MSGTDLFLDGIDFNGCDLPPLLPLVHTIDSMTGIKYINAGILPKPENRCENFPDDNPVYLFYGKPAYKKMDEGTSCDPADHKMVFILKDYPKVSNDIMRVFPFDSGAFFKGFFEFYIDPSLYSLDDFKMDTDIKEMPKHICFFWGDNTKFFKYKEPKAINTLGLRFVIHVYYNLIKSGRREPFDDRCSVPEVQSEEIHNFLDCLQAIVVSDEIDKSHLTGSTRNALIKKDIEIIPYDTFGRADARDMSNIYRTVLEYFRDKEIL